MRSSVKDFVRSVAHRAAGTGRVAEDLGKVRRRVRGVDDRQRAHEARSQEIEQQLQHAEQRLHTMEGHWRAALARLDEMEQEIQEGRQLNRRIAELTDLVGQVLLPSADRDEDALRARLMAYNEHLTR